MNQKKILLIGAAGKQGKEYFELLKNHYCFTGLVDSNFNALESVYPDIDHNQLFDNVEDAILKIDFDLAIVCVPHDKHLSTTLPLIEKNKIVIKEKPLALTCLEIQQYLSTRELPKLFTIVQRQFNPIFSQARDDLKTIGRIFTYNYDYSFKFSEITKGWRSQFDSAGGGVLIDMGYHILDIVLSYFGFPESVNGNFSFCYNEMEQEQLEDSASLLLRHSNGIQGTISLNRHSYIKREEFEILSTRQKNILMKRTR